MPILTVTADNGANQKILRQLKKDGLIEFHYINLEDAIIKYYEKNIPAFFMLDVSTLNGSDTLAPEDDIAGLEEELRRIIGGGRQNHQDRRQLLGHYCSGNDIFVSEDRDDILDNKEHLAKLGIIVMSPQELNGFARKRVSQ